MLLFALLNGTLFGRYVYAVGGNQKSARIPGISVVKIKVLVYTLCGALAGIAGLILTALVTRRSAAADGKLAAEASRADQWRDCAK